MATFLKSKAKTSPKNLSIYDLSGSPIQYEKVAISHRTHYVVNA
jgi:hypothetical protein